MILENDRLLLRPTEYTDLDFVLTAEKADGNHPYITPYSAERHRQVIEREDEEHWIISSREDRRSLGFVMLGTDRQNRSLEFRRIVVNPKGRGIGRQCLQLIKEYCFTLLDFHRLWLDVFEFNHRAIRLYKSEGFVEEAKLIECLYREGKFHNLLLFSMLSSEYSRGNSNGVRIKTKC